MGFFKNGYLQYAILTDGGTDEFNRPLPAIIEWSAHIPCHIMTYNHRNDGVVTDGIFTNSSYKVWLEIYDRDLEDKWSLLSLSEYGFIELDDTGLMIDTTRRPYKNPSKFNPERVRLIHDTIDIGEWQVQNISYKRMSGRIEILIGNRLNRQV